MIDDQSAYYYFFETMQTVTDMFDYVQSATKDFDAQINELANRLEVVADRAVKMAAEQSWSFSIRESGIQETWTECQRLFDDEFADFFRS